MSTSRRSFIAKGSMVALAAGVPSGLATVVSAAEKVTTGSKADTSLTKAAFASQLNTEFLIKSGARKVKSRLVSVSDLPQATPAHARSNKEGFSLLFCTEHSTPLQQETYKIEHQKLGKFSFFMVPTGVEDKNVRFYQVVVNRLYP